jgi:hypothetical protein
MRLVGIEASQQDLQLSFRCQRQITKFRGSKIEVKVSGEKILEFRGKKLRCTEVGFIYRGVGQLRSWGFKLGTCKNKRIQKRTCRS